jgi:hypothetical protein
MKIISADERVAEVSNPPTLSEQAAAVRRAAVNHNGHVNNLCELVARRKRPQHELDIAIQWLPALLAAADTMEEWAQQTGRIDHD